MKSAFPLAALVLAVGLGWVAHRPPRPDGEAARLQAALTAARDSARVLDSVLVTARAGFAAELATKERDAQALRRLAAAAGDTLRTAIETLLVQAPDSLRPALVQLGQQAAAAQRACQGALAAQDSVTASCSRQLVFFRDTALMQVTGQRDAAQQLLAESLRRPRGHGWKTDVALVAAAIAGTLLLH